MDRLNGQKLPELTVKQDGLKKPKAMENKETKIKNIREWIAHPDHKGASFTWLQAVKLFGTSKISTRIGEEERRQGKTLVDRERIRLKTGEYVTKYTII
jgi:hypothetical protein